MYTQLLFALLTTGFGFAHGAVVRQRDESGQTAAVSAPLGSKNGPLCKDLRDTTETFWFTGPVCAVINKDKKLITDLFASDDWSKSVETATVMISKFEESSSAAFTENQVAFTSIQDGLMSDDKTKAWWPSALMKAATYNGLSLPQISDPSTSGGGPDDKSGEAIAQKTAEIYQMIAGRRAAVEILKADDLEELKKVMEKSEEFPVILVSAEGKTRIVSGKQSETVYTMVSSQGETITPLNLNLKEFIEDFNTAVYLE